MTNILICFLVVPSPGRLLFTKTLFRVPTFHIPQYCSPTGEHTTIMQPGKRNSEIAIPSSTMRSTNKNQCKPSADFVSPKSFHGPPRLHLSATSCEYSFALQLSSSGTKATVLKCAHKIKDLGLCNRDSTYKVLLLTPPGQPKLSVMVTTDQ